MKNTDEQTDGSGDIAASQQYDAFGNFVSSYQTWAGPFGYGGAYGYQTDGDHGLMLLGHRYYEADTGRFLTRDPIKDGRNWYGYCGGSPVAWADLDGLEQVLIIVGPAKTKSEAKTDRTIARERQRKYQEMGYTVGIILPETVHHLDRELAEEDLLAIEVIAHGGRPGVPSARIGGPGSNRKVLVGSDKSVLLTPTRILSKMRTRLELLSLCVCDAGSPDRIEGWKKVPLTLVSYKGKVNTSEWNRQHPPKRLRSGPASR